MNQSEKYFKLSCLSCDYHTNSTRDYIKHCATGKHLNATNASEISTKSTKLLSCNICDYTTSNLRDYNKHCTTRKHIKSTENTTNSSPNSKPTYVCKKCNKQYSERTGLWRHNKKCITHSNNIQTENTEYKSDLVDLEPTSPVKDSSIVTDYIASPSTISPSILHEQPNSKDVMCELLKELSITNKQNIDLQKQNVDIQKQNAEFQNRLLEFMKDNTNHFVSNNITNNNCNNTQVNVNMFLNEQCKDAITLNAFIQSISPTFDEVPYMANNGNKEGLYKIIKNSFSQIELTKRPIHCTDLKRHTTYVKDETGWLKEHDQTHLRKLCGKVEHACLVKTLAIIEGDERYTTNGTEEYEDSIRMMQESVGGRKGPVHNHGLILKSLEEQIALDQEKMKNTIKN